MQYPVYCNMCPQKNKPNYPVLLAQRHQTATKRSNFWPSDLRDNCESAYDYVFHLACVVPIRFRQVTFWR